MKILITESSNIVVGAGEEIEKGIFPEADPDIELYKIIEGGKSLYFVANGYAVKDVGNVEVPNDYLAKRYCYTKENGFFVDPNWTEPEPTMEQKVSDLQDYTADLLYQVCLLQLGTSDYDVSTNKKGGE